MQTGADEDKIREVAAWRESHRFSEVERTALEYAEAMTITGQRVSDQLFARLRGHFDEALFEEAVVDLEPGDSLVLLTDGVIEAPGADGKRASFDRVLQTLDRARGERAQAQAEALTGGLLAEAAGRMSDDMTAFVLKRA